MNDVTAAAAVLGLQHRDEHLVGAAGLLQGRIIQLPVPGDQALAYALSAAAWVRSGGSVHVVTRERPVASLLAQQLRAMLSPLRVAVDEWRLADRFDEQMHLYRSRVLVASIWDLFADAVECKLARQSLELTNTIALLDSADDLLLEVQGAAAVNAPDVRVQLADLLERYAVVAGVAIALAPVASLLHAAGKRTEIVAGDPVAPPSILPDLFWFRGTDREAALAKLAVPVPGEAVIVASQDSQVDHLVALLAQAHVPVATSGPGIRTRSLLQGAQACAVPGHAVVLPAPPSTMLRAEHTDRLRESGCSNIRILAIGRPQLRRDSARLAAWASGCNTEVTIQYCVAGDDPLLRDLIPKRLMPLLNLKRKRIDGKPVSAKLGRLFVSAQM